METIQIIQFAGCLVLLWIFTIVTSSHRSRGLAFRIAAIFDSHAAGLDAYRKAASAMRQLYRDSLADAKAIRATQAEINQHREKAVGAARAQFERKIQ